MKLDLSDEQLNALADMVAERLRKPYRRPSPEEIITGAEAAKRMNCCYNTFKKLYVKTEKIRPVATGKGRHSRGFTSASVERLRRVTFPAVSIL